MIDPVLLDLGAIKIRWYSVLIATAIVIAYFMLFV